MHALDWTVVALYVVFALGVGVLYARRAGKNVDEFFLAGRTLPWWIAGTSMVATTFASDTPLVITGFVRNDGIWMNWVWWCSACGGMLTVFLFARYWRRGRVMTTAELSELRYSGKEASVLRGFLGFVHAGFVNTIILCWVILGASKVMVVALDIDKNVAVAGAGALALMYSLLAGFWGVVLTDLLQFTIAMVGAIALGFLALQGVGGIDAVQASVASGAWSADLLRFLPESGGGSPFSAEFWTPGVAMVTVFLGIQWWYNHGIDGGPTVVQRVAASRDERQGVLAALWYTVATFALRPWPWIAVALASLVVLPRIEVEAGVDGIVSAQGEGWVEIAPDNGDETVRHTWSIEDEYWRAEAKAALGDEVESTDIVAATDAESAYPAMMMRYLPIGLLGLVMASFFAAFMSTIDTHVNLAASYFVNDLYRRFLTKDGSATHYVLVARLASAAVLGLACVFAILSDSIGNLFTFFLAFLSGVGPVYVLRWLWWRIRASTEIVAMVTSMTIAIVLSVVDIPFPDHPLVVDGELSHAGRIVIVAVVSTLVTLVAVFVTPKPNPYSLVRFYRAVRPMGWWGPVRQLCRDAPPRREAAPVVWGFLGGVAATYGLLFGTGHLIFGRYGESLICLGVTLAGTAFVIWALSHLELERESA